MFHSQREATRYGELKMLERSGYLTGLKLQPRFPLHCNGIKVCTYVADFSYLAKDGKPVIEDTKGYRTAMYRLKKKMFECCYPDLRIVEL